MAWARRALISIVVAGCLPVAASDAADWNNGDVFVGIGGGQYEVYSNAGVFKETLTDTFGGVYTTGCVYHTPSDTMYATNYTQSLLIRFAGAHPHARTSFGSGGNPEDIAFAQNGDFVVTQTTGDPDLIRHNAAGTIAQNYENGGDRADFLDLSSDQHTLFYSTEGPDIRRYDLTGNAGAGQELTIFNQVAASSIRALQLLPPGDGSGGLLAANQVNILRYDGAGAVTKTYDQPDRDYWFGANLDPNGTSFWAADLEDRVFYRFNLDSGAVELGPIATQAGSNIGGLCLKGEPTAALDNTPPVTVATVTPPANGAGWHNSAATIDLTATDEVLGSGVKEIETAFSGAQTGSQTTAGATAQRPVTLEGQSVLSFFAEDNAGNTETAKQTTLKLDLTVPDIAVTSPALDTTFAQGDAATADFACSDPGALPSGIVSCTGSSADGAPLDTSTAGTKTLTITATDAAGNNATVMRQYTVLAPAVTPTPTPAPTGTPTPAPTAAPAPARFDQVVVLPSTRKCVSRRKFRIRLRATKADPLVSATVLVNAKRVKVVRGKRLTAPVNLTGLPRGRFSVTIRATTKSGRTISGTRRYRTCRARQRGGNRSPI